MGEEIVENPEVLRKAVIADVRSGAQRTKEIARSPVARANAEDSLVTRVIRAVKWGFDAKSIRGQIKGGESDATSVTPNSTEG